MRRPALVPIALTAVLPILFTRAGTVPVDALPGPVAGQPGTPALVVTQAPVGTSSPWLSQRHLLDARYPAGTRIVLVHPSSAGSTAPARVLSGRMMAAGAPAVSSGADAVLFAGKVSTDTPWGIYHARLDTGRPRLMVSLDRDCTDPAWLPEGRIVFSCHEPGREHDARWSLYTASIIAPRGTAPERITFGPGAATDPSPLPDGRILFSMTLPPGRGRTAGSIALFTVNPDGTLLEPFAGAHEAAALKMRPRASRGGEVHYLGAAPGDSPVQVMRMAMNRPAAPALIVAGQPPMGTDASPASAGPGRSDWDHLTSSERLPDGRFLITGRPAGSRTITSVRDDQVILPATRGVYATGDGGVEPIFDAPEWDEVEAVPVLRRTRPHARPSAVDRSRDSGVLLCHDAARTDAAIGPASDAPRPVTLQVQTAPPDTECADPTGETCAYDIATMPIEPDGSFLTEVPADRPLRVLTIDIGGDVIATSGWFWVRPGEVRSCFGCHEDRQAAPVNRVIRALLPGPPPEEEAAK